MIKIQFKDGDSDTLFSNFLREDHHKARLKNLVLYCKSIGMSHGEILDFCRISEPTLASYLKEFQSGGFEALKKTSGKGQPSDLNRYIDLIDEDFSMRPPKSAVEAQGRIQELTGIKRSPTQIRSFMRDKLGYRFLKAGAVPGNGREDDNVKELEREEFKKKLSTHCWTRPGKEKG